MGHYISDDQDLAMVVNDTRKEPWHLLGTWVRKAMKAAEALKLANLGEWGLSLEPAMWYEESVDDVIVVPGKFVVVRTNPKTGQREALGVVGSGFEIYTNEEAFAWMDAIVANLGGAHYDTAGFLRPLAKDGTALAQVFLTIDLGDAGNVVLDPNGAADQLSSKLYGTFGHDGSLAFTAGVSTQRILCWNTQLGALASSQSKWKTKHTRNMRQRMDQAREVLGLSVRHVERMHEGAEKLVHAKFTNKQFDKLILDVFPMPSRDDEHYRTKSERVEGMHDDLRILYLKAPHNQNISGTKWGAFQTVVEYVDWYRSVKGHTTKAAETVVTRRATGIVTGAGDPKKQRALALLNG
jgi:phage/plasmid-like protein (TIGR03299 family)